MTILAHVFAYLAQVCLSAFLSFTLMFLSTLIGEEAPWTTLYVLYRVEYLRMCGFSRRAAVAVVLLEDAAAAIIEDGVFVIAPTLLAYVLGLRGLELVAVPCIGYVLHAVVHLLRSIYRTYPLFLLIAAFIRCVVLVSLVHVLGFNVIPVVVGEALGHALWNMYLSAEVIRKYLTQVEAR